MKYHLILRKFEMDSEKLKKKLADNGYNISVDKLSKRIIAIGDGGGLKKPDEVSVLLKEECFGEFSQENLRNAVIELGRKFDEVNLRVKAYPGIRIPESAIKKKLAKFFKAGEGGVNLLVELYNDKGLKYRILSYENKMAGDKSGYENLAVLVENPRLVEEIGDFLRLCLVFGLKMIVVHDNKDEFTRLLNKAKEATKGRLRGFDVSVFKDLSDVKGYVKIGFSKSAEKGEKDFAEFVKRNRDRKLLLVFGNDTFGLSQNAREKVDVMFHLTPDYQKPLKGNQALAYVLGIYSGA